LKIENQSTASQGSMFEHQVSQMFAGLGIFENITVTQRSNDGGIDILMEGITRIGDIIKCGVECKDLDCLCVCFLNHYKINGNVLFSFDNPVIKYKKTKRNT